MAERFSLWAIRRIQKSSLTVASKNDPVEHRHGFSQSNGRTMEPTDNRQQVRRNLNQASQPHLCCPTIRLLKIQIQRTLEDRRIGPQATKADTSSPCRHQEKMRHLCSRSHQLDPQRNWRLCSNQSHRLRPIYRRTTPSWSLCSHIGPRLHQKFGSYQYLREAQTLIKGASSIVVDQQHHGGATQWSHGLTRPTVAPKVLVLWKMLPPAKR